MYHNLIVITAVSVPINDNTFFSQQQSTEGFQCKVKKHSGKFSTYQELMPKDEDRLIMFCPNLADHICIIFLFTFRPHLSFVPYGDNYHGPLLLTWIEFKSGMDV